MRSADLPVQVAVFVRTGQEDGEAELTKRIGHARDQLVTTARLIRERHPAFAEIPDDRPPLVGLILTLEPFHLHQTLRAEALFAGDELPVSAACAHDVEGTVALLSQADDAGARLLRELSAASAWQRRLREAADGLPDRRNAIPDAAYKRWSALPHHADQPL